LLPITPWSEQDNQVLVSLIEKGKQANENLMSRLQAASGFTDLTPRQQAKLYAVEAG